MSGIRSATFAALAAAALVLWVSMVRAQGPQDRDYLSAELRAQVEQLQRSASSAATSSANLKERLDTLWPWINAYALTGGPMPVNATLQVATAYRAVEALRLDGTQPSAAVLEAIDGLVHEFTIKDKQPGALGTVSLEVAGPAHVGAWTTIKQTYTVGEASLGPGARIMVAKQLQADGGLVQNSDPDGPHYLSASTSNREGQAGQYIIPLVGDARRLPGPGAHARLQGRGGHSRDRRHGDVRLRRPQRRIGGVAPADVRHRSGDAAALHRLGRLGQLPDAALAGL